MRQKIVPDPFLSLVNNMSYESFFFSNPVSFSGQNYQKKKGHGTSEQLLLRLRNKFRKIPLLIMHYLTKFDDVI